MSNVHVQGAGPGVPATEDGARKIIADDDLANDELYAAFQAREEATKPADPNATDSPSGEGDAGADEGVAPSESAPVPSEDGDGEEGQGQEAPEEVAPETTPDMESFNLLDRTLSRSDAEEALRVMDWSRGLQPDHVQAIDAVLSGEYVLVSRAEYEASNRAAPAATGAAAGMAPSPTFDDDDDLDPAIRARFDHLNQTIEGLTSQQQQVLQRQQQENHAQVIARVTEGANRFATAHALTADESRSLQERVVSMQILPGYAATYNNDAAMAMEKAMEAVYWTDDTFRQREVDKRLAAEAKSKTDTQVRTRKAGSLTGGGGSVPRVEAAPTKEDMRGGMVKEIADAMNGGQRS